MKIIARIPKPLSRWPLAALLCAAAPWSAAEGDDWVSLTRDGGAALYDSKCGMCHDEGGMGTGILGRRFDPAKALLVNREDLEPAFIRTVVREGFGIMFPISRAEVSDEQLDAITGFLSGAEGGRG